MIKKFCGLLMLIGISVGILSGCSSSKIEKHSIRMVEDHMFDTVVTFIVYTDDEEEFSYFTKELKEQYAYYHKLYDKYNSYPGLNNIKSINEAAGTAEIEVSQDIIDLLSYAKEMHYETGGKNNIALGAVLEVWHDYRDLYSDPFEYPKENISSEIPPEDLLESKREHIDIENVIIDDISNTVFLKDPEMSIDVGGVAKGFATEKIAQHLIEKGLENFAISAGGNVRVHGYSFGENGEKRPWNTGITDPIDRSNPSIANVITTSGSVVSSGDYERFYWYDQKRYSHIIDGDTLLPGLNYAQITVYTEDSGLADYLSTEIFLLPKEEGEKIAEKFNAEVLWVYHDGTIEQTSDFFKVK
ncbi:FAD:protein FMN transferase [Proteiniclasticum sp. C24MP]|uniref:FAD:protein FMN transferase n=1 Tax=Proteiniclasticum sp. C24MP TaxID=3374101 RepID=UPI003754F17B